MMAKLKESREYLGRPAIKIVSNTQRIDMTKFNDESIVFETVV